MRGGKLVVGSDREGREVYVAQRLIRGRHMVGWQLVATDGTSLLSGDDKLALLCWSTLARYKDQTAPCALAFVLMRRLATARLFWTLMLWCCGMAHTIDGGPFGEFCCETFNAR